jgi:type VI secretion system protein VasG
MSREKLYLKLHPVAMAALEQAHGVARRRGNPYVELAHWLDALVRSDKSDLRMMFGHAEIDEAALEKDLLAELESYPKGATAVGDFSAQIDVAVEKGWLTASTSFGQERIRSGHVLLGLLQDSALARQLHRLSNQFRMLKPERVSAEFDELTRGSEEAQGQATPASLSSQEAGAPAAGDVLGKYTVDLTAQAREGKIDSVIGRDGEIRQIIDILQRRRQNNPILTGEPGVGKTAVVEGLAVRIAKGDVPPMLKDVVLRSLDLGALQAGASMKGEFEQRLKSLIEQVQASRVPIILFIDEAHMLVGAGGGAGSAGDAANLLKPALARGTLRTIAATTWAEYKKYFEKDPALTRRFQPIKVDEPSLDAAVRMMRMAARAMEAHHGVEVLDEAVKASVHLSARYLPSRQLPDKSISLLDTACARVAVRLHATPPDLEDALRRREAVELELQMKARERAVGIDTAADEAALTAELGVVNALVASLESRLEAERKLVARVRDLRSKLGGQVPTTLEESQASGAGFPAEEQDQVSVAEPAESLAKLREAESELRELQGEHPLVLPFVNETVVAGVVGDWTGIPVGRMVRDEFEVVLSLADRLGKRVVGQGHAHAVIADRIKVARAGLSDPRKPVGVFLMAGPSGVGKTETALALAEQLYGGEQNLVTINMSEFQEAHTVSTLKGAPPGYVGYGEGGVLTEAVRRRPYCVILLDEVEKAHPDVHEIFFQVFDKGSMEDGEGRRIDFRNTLILLTTNAGSNEIIDAWSRDRASPPSAEALAAAIRPALREVFPDALLGRMTAVPFYPLSDDVLRSIARISLDKVVRRAQEKHGIDLTYTDAVLDTILARCREVESGGRVVEGIVTNAILPELSASILRDRLRGEEPGAIELDSRGGCFLFGPAGGLM